MQSWPQYILYIHTSVSQFYFECDKQLQKLPSLFTPISRTCTSLRVARLSCFAFTILPAIRRRRIAANSVESTATASCRACAKPRPSPIKCTLACNAICNAGNWSFLIQLANGIQHGNSMACQNKESNNHAQIKNNLTHPRKQVAPAQACVLHALIASPVHPFPPFAGAGLLQVLL